ncbi:MAG: GDP-mannose 4,6-dehydratase [Nakamurella sp.]
MTTALITGVSGQDGGYLAERLLAEGVSVHGLVRSAEDSAPVVASMPGLSLHVGDLNEVDSVTRLIRRLAPDEIYNLAGISSVAQSWAEPIATGRVSGLAAAGLLQAAWEFGESTGRQVRVVQASSAEIFGSPEISPQNESTPIAPITPYGAAKAYAHHMVKVYRSRGLFAVSAVLYNHESPRRPATFVTRKITQGVARIAQGKQTELRMGNLDAHRDWGWAPDYVDAMIRAARHDEPDDYIVATGQSHSVRDFVAAAFLRAGIEDFEEYIKIDPAFVRPVDAADLRGDASRARHQLGWKPTVSFAELVGRMVDADLS